MNKILRNVLICALAFFSQACRPLVRNNSSLLDQTSSDGSFKESCTYVMVKETLVSTCAQDKYDRFGVLSFFENIRGICGDEPLANTNGTITCGTGEQMKKSLLVKNSTFNKPPLRELCDQCAFINNKTALACRCFDKDALAGRDSGNAYLTILKNVDQCKGGTITLEDFNLSCGANKGLKIKSRPPNYTPQSRPGDSGCFSNDMMVRLASDKRKLVGDLNWSDQVLSAATPINSPKAIKFDSAYFIDYMYQFQGIQEFYRFTTESGRYIEMTPVHLIFVQRDSEQEPRDIVAEDVVVGDRLFLVREDRSVVEDRIVKKEKVPAKAAYAPLVGKDATLVVNDFIVSSYVSFLPLKKVKHRLSHQEITNELINLGIRDISLPLRSELDALNVQVMIQKMILKLDIEYYSKEVDDKGPIPWLKDIPTSLLPKDFPPSRLP